MQQGEEVTTIPLDYSDKCSSDATGEDVTSATNKLHKNNGACPVVIEAQHSLTARSKDANTSTSSVDDTISEDMLFEDEHDEPSRVRHLTRMALAIAAIGYLIYFGFAMTSRFGRPPFPFPNPADVFDNNPGLALMTLSVVVLLFIVWELLVFVCAGRCKLGNTCLTRPKAVFIAKIFCLCLLLVLIGVYLTIYVGTKNPRNFVSLFGLFVFIFGMFIFSKHPSRVNWIPVLNGTIIQFALAVFVLRTEFGLKFFDFFGNQSTGFLDFAKTGTAFVFGKLDCFAFDVLPVLVFFSAVANVLFYSGFLQYLTKKVAWCMSLLMGTSAGESFNAAASTFLGQSEGPLLIKPMLPIMTPSELFCVMTGGFATIAGSVMAAYILFGVPANHLIAASIMSAPAALVCAKLLYPETKKSRNTWDMVDHLPKAEEKNVIEALCNGAAMSIPIVANIAVNLIAFLSLLSFLNAATSWFFGNVQHPEIDFQKLLAWCFYPVAWLIGVSSRDCLVVGEMLGIKTFLNEFIAYQKLGKIIDFRDSLLKMNGTALESYHGAQPVLYEHRSVIITTYALCGYSNLVAIGIELAGLTTLAPSRKHILSKIALRAMIAGNIACFMTACIAGLLYEER